MRRRRRRSRGARSTADLASSHLASSRSRSRCEPRSREIAPTRKRAQTPAESWLRLEASMHDTLARAHADLASWRAWPWTCTLLPPDGRRTTFPRRPGGSRAARIFLPAVKALKVPPAIYRRLIPVPIGSVSSHVRTEPTLDCYHAPQSRTKLQCRIHPATSLTASTMRDVAHPSVRVCVRRQQDQCLPSCLPSASSHRPPPSLRRRRSPTARSRSHS